MQQWQNKMNKIFLKLTNCKYNSFIDIKSVEKMITFIQRYVYNIILLFILCDKLIISNFILGVNKFVKLKDYINKINMKSYQ